VESGYVRGVSLRGAPYDFRYAPHSQAFYFTRLRQLVEETWALNGRRRVVLLAHSMGGLYAAYFLARQPADWKDRYVEALITVNTPWAGQPHAVIIASGVVARTAGGEWGLHHKFEDIETVLEKSFLVQKLSSENAKVGVQNPHFGKKSAAKMLSTHNQFFVENCKLLPRLFLTHAAAVHIVRP